MELDIRSEIKPNYVLVIVGGEIDVYSAPQIKEKIIPALQYSNNILIDLGGVSFIDSTGFGVLVGILKRVREREGTLKLIFESERLHRLFSIADLDKIFHIFKDEKSAAENSEPSGRRC